MTGLGEFLRGFDAAGTATLSTPSDPVEDRGWCAFRVELLHGSDWDTTGYVLERLVGLTLRLKLANERHVDVHISDWQRVIGGETGRCDRHEDIEAIGIY